MDVAGGHGAHAEVLREVVQECVAARVAALEGSLQLDVEAVGPERLRQPDSGVRVAHREPAARAAREADEAVAELGHGLEGDGRPEQDTMLLALGPRSRMGRGEDAAEVRVPGLALAEQRHVRGIPPSPPAPTPQSVTSAPVMGRTPRLFAACANSSEP